MTRLTVETDNEWTKRKIKSALNIETELLKKAVQKCKVKLDQFEKKYGKLDRPRLTDKIKRRLKIFGFRMTRNRYKMSSYPLIRDRDSLYGKIDDMELIEWEGEKDTLLKLQEKLSSLEEISFEYK